MVRCRTRLRRQSSPATDDETRRLLRRRLPALPPPTASSAASPPIMPSLATRDAMHCYQARLPGRDGLGSACQDGWISHACISSPYHPPLPWHLYTFHPTCPTGVRDRPGRQASGQTLWAASESSLTATLPLLLQHPLPLWHYGPTHHLPVPYMSHVLYSVSATLSDGRVNANLLGVLGRTNGRNDGTGLSTGRDERGHRPERRRRETQRATYEGREDSGKQHRPDMATAMPS